MNKIVPFQRDLTTTPEHLRPLYIIILLVESRIKVDLFDSFEWNEIGTSETIFLNTVLLAINGYLNRLIEKIEQQSVMSQRKIPVRWTEVKLKRER